MGTTTEDPFDIRKEIVRIDLAIAETRKFLSDCDKLTEEAAKISRRDRWLAPVLAIVSVIGGLAGFASAVVTAIRLAH